LALEAQACLFLAVEHPDGRADHPFQPIHDLRPVGGVPKGGGGHGHDDVRLGIVEGTPQPLGGGDGGRHAVGRDGSRGTHTDPEVQ
jgi:hypothetical protein